MGANQAVMKKAPTAEEQADRYGNYDEAKGPFWTTDRSQGKEPVLSKAGQGAQEPMTIIDFFKKTCKNKGAKAALCVERPLPKLDGKKWPPALPLGEWKTWSFTQYYDDVILASKALIALGLERGDGVSIFGFNAPEWFMGQMSAIFAGGIAAGIYPSDTPEQVCFKARHSHAAIAVCETEKQAAMFRKFAAEGKLPHLKAIIIWDFENPSETKNEDDNDTVTEVHWSNLKTFADKVTDEQLDAVIAETKPSSVCAYIYTSGTTGNPKAVMITHDNVTFVAGAVLNNSGDLNKKAEQERVISYLPLSHVAGMMLDITCPISTPDSPAWTTTYFARPYDLKAGSIGDRLRAVRPTLFLGVPRVWEKISEKMKAKGAETTGLKKTIATFAKKKGLAHAQELQMGGKGKKPMFHGIANTVVLSKVADALGLDKVKLALTGAAPIAVETLEYFGALGIHVNECYGMSESTGATSWSSNEAHVWGSCGWQLPSTEVKCFKVVGKTKTEVPAAKDLFHPSEEEQGELCFRGRHIMAGYMANPDLGEEHVAEITKKNEDAIDEEGWLHSGDKGCIDARGMIRITGRYKELIITAGGENVAPVPIEDELKANCPMISNAMMVGDQRKYNVVLLTLKAEGASGELPGNENLDAAAASFDAAIKTIPDACCSKKYITAIEDAIKKTNKSDAVPSNACKIQKFTILSRDFSSATGELTPTLKTKRSVVAKMHSELLDRMYSPEVLKMSYIPEDPNAVLKEEEKEADEKSA